MNKQISNNNQHVIRLLAGAIARGNRGRNRILIGATTLSIVVLCTIFSIALGKIKAEYIQSARSSGTIASTWLETPTMKQYHDIQNLNYVKSAGRCVDAGQFYYKGEYLADVRCLDNSAWQEMTVPACTGIEGHYPQKEGEIMLPVRVLDQLDIEEPKLNMPIPLQYNAYDYDSAEITFRLSGWYTDYVDPAEFMPLAYVSENQLYQWGLTMEEPTILMIQQNLLLDEYDIEERLYEDIGCQDASQQFIGGNTAYYSIIEDFTGGFLMAAILSGLILVSVFSLIRNLLAITMQNDIRQIGLLNVLGTTSEQVRKIYYLQIIRIQLIGVIAGVLISSMVELWIIPQILGNLYLYHYGKSAEMMEFRPGVFLLSVLFTVVVILGAVIFTLQKATRLTPLQALYYRGKVSASSKQLSEKYWNRKKKDSNQSSRFWSKRVPFLLALKHLSMQKKRVFMTVLSLFLGIMMALSTVVISKGMDETNRIEQDPDFSISGNDLVDAIWKAQKPIDEAYAEYAPVSDNVRKHLLSISGIDTHSVRSIEGTYLMVNTREYWNEPFWKEEWGDREQGNTITPTEEATFRIVDDAYIDKLEAYVEEENLCADMESLRNGTGVVLLHIHELSPEKQAEADQMINEPIAVWYLHTKAELDDIQKHIQLDKSQDSAEICPYQKAPEYTISGYLDAHGQGFPRLDQTRYDPGMIYFLISEAGFERLRTNRKTFQISFDVEPESEPGAKAAIRKILQEGNRDNPAAELYVLCKSDTLASAQSYIRTNRIILGTLSAVLIFMGVLNFLNVLSTEVFSREKEFALLESVGMTGRQIHQMLMMEGGCYFTLTMLLVLIVGTGILHFLNKYMSARSAFFHYTYPMYVLFLMIGLILFICMIVPKVLYWRIERKNLSQRFNI